MAGVNKVIIVGNLGKDPECRYMPNGSAVANITVATSDTWKDKQTGEQKEKTEWHRVVMFGKLAEIAGEYLQKGSKVYLEGSLQTRKWTNQQGQEQYTTEIVLQGFQGVMQMLDGKNNSQGNQQGQQNNNQNQNQNQGQDNSQGGFSNQNNNQGGFSNQNNNQGNQNNNQGGFKQNQNQSQQNNNNGNNSGFRQQNQNQNQNQGQNQGQRKVNPQEPSIDFDDDIPFAPVGLPYNNFLIHVM